jgi:hypothetical protein
MRAALGRRHEFAPQAAVIGQKIDSYGGPAQAVKEIEALATWQRLTATVR